MSESIAAKRPFDVVDHRQQRSDEFFQRVLVGGFKRPARRGGADSAFPPRGAQTLVAGAVQRLLYSSIRRCNASSSVAAARSAASPRPGWTFRVCTGLVFGHHGGLPSGFSAPLLGRCRGFKTPIAPDGAGLVITAATQAKYGGAVLSSLNVTDYSLAEQPPRSSSPPA
ncbi:MAG: hypothetical protein IPH23_14635 [Gammaproteobacteria bacterium]|nr:hypothetical protein [Gammaproteobacteria bacterium]